MAEGWEGLSGAGGPMSRRGAVRLLASGVAVVAGSAVLAACGGPAVPGSVATNGSGTPDPTKAQPTDAQSMVSNSGGTVSLVATGSAIGTTTTDTASYYFGPATGDGTWICQVAKQGSSAADHGNALAGIMARNDGTDGAAFAGVFITDGNGVTFRWRSADGQPGQQWPMAIAIGVTAPIWLKLANSAGTFSCWYSTDGKTWNNKTSMAVTFSNTTYLVGLAATSASTTQQLDQFTNLSGFKPNRFLNINPSNTAENSSSSK